MARVRKLTKYNSRIYNFFLLLLDVNFYWARIEENCNGWVRSETNPNILVRER